MPSTTERKPPQKTPIIPVLDSLQPSIFFKSSIYPAVGRLLPNRCLHLRFFSDYQTALRHDRPASKLASWFSMRYQLLMFSVE